MAKQGHMASLKNRMMGRQGLRAYHLIVCSPSQQPEEPLQPPLPQFWPDKLLQKSVVINFIKDCRIAFDRCR